MKNLLGVGAGTAIGGAVAFLIAMGCWTIVPSGHYGVLVRVGAVQPNSLAEGFHLKLPLLDSVKDVDVRLRRETVLAEAASKDLQEVSTEVAVQYSLIGPMTPQTYQHVGASPEIVSSKLIAPAIQESVKAVTAQYTAEQLVTQRAQVKLGIQEAIERFINDTLNDRDLGGALRVANVAITDFAFSDEFNASIEAKVKAEQDALRAENEKVRRITQAEAKAAEVREAAEAEAFRTQQTAAARAEAIRIEGEALAQNPKLIELRAIEAWDGRLPTVSGGGAVPFIDMRALTASQEQATPGG